MKSREALAKCKPFDCARHRLKTDLLNGSATSGFITLLDNAIYPKILVLIKNTLTELPKKLKTFKGFQLVFLI